MGEVEDDISEGKNTIPSGALQSCSSHSFMKLKYSKHGAKTKSYIDNYDEGVITDQILGEITLNLDSYKTETQRESTQVLDLLGDIGGFEAAIQMIFVLVGEYFSAKYLMTSIARTLFIRKKNNKEVPTGNE